MLVLFALLSSSAYGIQTLPLVNEEEIIAQVKVNNNKISDIPENEFLEQYSYLKEGFKELSISIETDEAMFDKEDFYYPLSFFDKVKSFFGAEIPEYKIIKEVKKAGDELQTKIDLGGIDIETSYKKGNSVEQFVTLRNKGSKKINSKVTLKHIINADSVIWDGKEYEITEKPLTFKPYQIRANNQEFGNKISFYTASEEYVGTYNFSNLTQFKPKVEVFKNNSKVYMLLTLNASVDAGASVTMDPHYDVFGSADFNENYKPLSEGKFHKKVIDFPITANTTAKKVEYSYIAQEKLRLEHNEMGRQFREGIITKIEWERYLEEEFNPLNNELSDFIAPNREAVMKKLLNISKIDYMNETQQTKINNIKQQFKQSKKWEINTKKLLK